MKADYHNLNATQLLAEQEVLAYLRGHDQHPQWQAARIANPAFDERLLEAAALLELLDEAGREQLQPEEQALLATTWSRIAADTQQFCYSDATPPPTELHASAKPAPAAPAPARVVELRRDTRQRLNLRIYAWTAAIAASLLLLFWLQPDANTWQTDPGEQVMVYLPDSSAVWLGPGSELSVDAYADQREVELSGEAFFQVKRGSSFTVRTAHGAVQVLGTSFRVDASGAALHVRCQTGRVAVARAATRVELGPGESVRSEGAGLSDVRKEDPATEPAPDANVIVARDVTVEELAARIGRYYARSGVVDQSLAARRLTIELPTDDLAEAVRRVEFVLRARVDTSGRQLQIVPQ